MRAARILSRSSAITCMRVLSRSRDSTGISTVSAVAKAAIAASSVTMICGVSSDMNWSSIALASLEASFERRHPCPLRSAAAPQYLKLIIFLMTKMPHVIQTAAHASRNWPKRVVHSSVM